LSLQAVGKVQLHILNGRQQDLILGCGHGILGTQN